MRPEEAVPILYNYLRGKGREKGAKKQNQRFPRRKKGNKFSTCQREKENSEKKKNKKKTKTKKTRTILTTINLKKKTTTDDSQI